MVKVTLFPSAVFHIVLMAVGVQAITPDFRGVASSKAMLVLAPFLDLSFHDGDEDDVGDELGGPPRAALRLDLCKRDETEDPRIGPSASQREMDKASAPWVLCPRGHLPRFAVPLASLCRLKC
jgi:hypothetical protein